MKCDPGSININGKNFIAVATISKVFSCSVEYVAQLARDGKVTAFEKNRQWYVNDDSFRSYMAVRNQDSDMRMKHDQSSLEQMKKKAFTAKKDNQVVLESSVGNYAHALTLGMFLAGGVAGFYFFNAVPQDMQNTAAAVVATQDDSVDLTIQPSENLRPIFSETNEVKVGQKRFVEHPSAQAQWTYTNHE